MPTTIRFWNTAQPLVLAAALCVTACSSSESGSKSNETTPATTTTEAVEAEPAGDPQPEGKPVFEEFVVFDFNWELSGYDVLQIKKGGEVTMVAAIVETKKIKGETVASPVWYRLDWKISADELKPLVDMLESVEFRNLEPLYIDRNVDDGQNISYFLTDSTGTKKVTCSNEFPESIQSLRKFLASTMTAGKRDTLKTKGKRLSNEESEAFWKPWSDT